MIADVLREMGRTSAQGALFSHAVALQLGIGPTDLECLALLRDLGPSSAGQLAELLSLTTGAITGVIDRLESAGFVARASDPADRRRVIVRPLPDRLAEVDRAYEPLIEAASKTMADYQEDQLRLVLDFQRRASMLFQQETARLKAEREPWNTNAKLSAPLGPLEEARLEFANGAAGLRIHAGDDTAKLYHAEFEGGQPEVHLKEGVLAFRYKRLTLLDWGKHAGSLALNPNVAWSISLRGGASKVSLDARGLALRELLIQGGASRVDAFLPRPRGTVPVRVEGGVSRVRFLRPEGVPAQLLVRGGANRLELDGRRFGAIGGELRLASPGWDETADRYEVEVMGGASRLEVGFEAQN
ncbi:MAG TPA: MarR family transcriptional regulator [Chloroflexota bacterium]|nr:MarR family transcriptional regulator [Chloroflexota bacterium]